MAGRLILVVEDDPDIRELLVTVLSDEGYEVLTARHGQAALALLSAQAVDLICLDMSMPVMDGRAFLAAYAELPGPHVPVVLMSAARQNLPIGCPQMRDLTVAVLHKPFDLDALFRIVGALLPDPG